MFEKKISSLLLRSFPKYFFARNASVGRVKNRGTLRQYRALAPGAEILGAQNLKEIMYGYNHFMIL